DRRPWPAASVLVRHSERRNARQALLAPRAFHGERHGDGPFRPIVGTESDQRESRRAPRRRRRDAELHSVDAGVARRKTHRAASLLPDHIRCSVISFAARRPGSPRRALPCRWRGFASPLRCSVYCIHLSYIITFSSFTDNTATCSGRSPAPRCTAACRTSATSPAR